MLLTPSHKLASNVRRHAIQTNMKFSEKILNKAILSVYNELAWKKDDIFLAINELIENNIAILGGDVWGILKKQDIPILTRIQHERIAVGIIKGKDGHDYVYNWHSEKRSAESWEEFVQRSKNESIRAITEMNAESTVADEFRNSIYYNLVFANQTEYNNLIEKEL
jgi:hypothetical protein